MLKKGDHFGTEDINVHISNSQQFPLHSHEFLELEYVIEGTAKHILNGNTSIISKGDYFILDYGAEHAYTQSGETPFKVINCLFLPEFIDKSMTSCRNFHEVVNNYMIKYNCGMTNISPANYILHDDSKMIYTILSRMLDEYKSKKAGYQELLKCMLIELIVLTMRKSSPPVPTGKNALCEYIINYTEKNIESKNILGTISKKVNFSTSYLSRMFKSDMGISFSDYLQKRRIEYSCSLLANSDKKISEIAQLVGYSDMNFFNHVFKLHLGIAPREFRKINSK